MNQDVLIEHWQNVCHAFIIQHQLTSDIIEPLSRSLAASEFAQQFFFTHPALLCEVLKAHDRADLRDHELYRAHLAALPKDNEFVYMKALRRLRKQNLFKILYRAIGLKVNVEQTLKELSLFADCCLLDVMHFAQQQLDSQYLVPTDTNGFPQQLLIVALGKLGGFELNFSSDIDIYFVYPEESNGRAAGVDSGYYFTILAKKIVKYLSEVTEDGFVFRVDLRLRPNGHAGSTVVSLRMLETYYQEQGRDWERYAMLKARIVNASSPYAHQLLAIISPFVYRKYIDFSVLEALRSIKQVMGRVNQLKQLQQDIKRGDGGIREIEFICQANQLIRGGRETALRHPHIFKAIDALTEYAVFTVHDRQRLREAYCFLRQVENAIQMQGDQQTHQLPTEEMGKVQLLIALNMVNWKQFETLLSAHAREVSIRFNQMLGNKTPETHSDGDKLYDNQIRNLLMGNLSEIPAEDLLLTLGFEKPQQAFYQLYNFLNLPRYARLSQIAKRRVEAFLCLLLKTIYCHAPVDEIFVRLLSLLEQVMQRSAYLALLTENPASLQHLLKLFSLSPWIAQHLCEHPFLLEVLLDEQRLYQPLTEQKLANQLATTLQQSDTLEIKIERLKHFKLMQQLRVASAWVTQRLTAMEASQHLSRTAAVILKNVLLIALEQLSVKYTDTACIQDKFAIIAYGKLGSEELTLTSDLDLVFLHACESEDEVKVIKLSRSILHLLNTRTHGGRLYAVDTRLRPSGSAGLLVSHIDAFEEYQQHKAWVWEHQALVKARFITGANHLELRFNALRACVLGTVRETPALAKEVRHMRLKMKKQLGLIPVEAWKQQDGGLIDIEFFVQFIVLAFAQKHPDLLKPTSTLALINTIAKINLLKKGACKQLREHYCHLLEAFNQQIIQEVMLDKASNEARIRFCYFFKTQLAFFGLDWVEKA